MLRKLAKVISRIVNWFFEASWKKKTIIIALILLVGFLLGKKLFTNKTDGYVLATVQKRTLTETVSESGIIATTGKLPLYSPTTGAVSEVFVSNGEQVEENQKLFSVKSTATPQEKAAALATYQSTKAAVQQAENNRRSTLATVDRVHDDLKNKDATETFSQKEERTTAEVINDNAYDTLLSARGQLKSAQIAYQATQNAIVIAPVSGLISNLAVAVGSNVSVNSSLAPSSPVLIISGPGTTEIMILVGESDINKIKINQEVAIKLDAINNHNYTGIVKRVDENGSIIQGVVKFSVYIELIKPDVLLKSGMTADVDIITQELSDILSVPNSAIKPYQKGRAVRKIGSNKEPEFIPVKIGIRGKEFTQIIEGLAEGQEIIVSLTNEKAVRASPFGF